MIKKVAISLIMMFVTVLFVANANARWGRPKLVFHTFAFDALADSPDIEVTDFRYGTTSAPGARMPDWIKRDVGFIAQTMTSGPMIVGEELFVEWRIKETGEILSDLADLRGLMPKDISEHTVYFVIKDSRQLEVYLVTPKLRDENTPIVGPNKFHRNIVLKIYPELK